MMAALLTVVLAIGLGVLARDMWGWLPHITRAAIWMQTVFLPEARREVRRAEWYAELVAEYDDRRVTGLLWALSLCPISAWERLTTPVSAGHRRVRGVTCARKGARHILAPLIAVVAIYGVARLSGEIAAGANQSGGLELLIVYLTLCGAGLIAVERLAERSHSRLSFDLVELSPGVLRSAFPPVERGVITRLEDTMPIGHLMVRDMLEDSHRSPSGVIRLAAGSTSLIFLSMFIANAAWRFAAPSVLVTIGVVLAGAFFVVAFQDMAHLRRRDARWPWRTAVELGRYAPARGPTPTGTVPVLLILLLFVLVPYVVACRVWQDAGSSWTDRFSVASAAFAVVLGAWTARSRVDGPLMRWLERVTMPVSALLGRALLPAWRAARIFTVMLLAAGLSMVGAVSTAPATSQASLEPWGTLGVVLIGVGLMLARLFWATWRRPVDVKVVSGSELLRDYLGDVGVARVTKLLSAGLFVMVIGLLVAVALS